MADENRMAAECFRRGNDAMNKSNWDLAVEMFSSCVKLAPGNLTYRQLLRQSTKKKYKDNGKGAGAFSMAKIMSLKGKIKKAKAAEDWEEASKACEEVLLLNPWETSVLVDLGEVSIKLDRGEIAKFSLFEACKTDPKAKANWALLASLLHKRDEYDEAIKVWEKVSQMDPGDMNAVRKITELQTEKTTHRGGYEDAGSTRDIATNKAATAGRTGGSMAPGESQEMDLKHAIRKEPEKVEHYLKLAAYQRSKKQFAESLETYRKALEISGGNPEVKEQVENAELLVMKAQLDALKDQAADSDDPLVRQKVAAAANAYRDRDIEVLTGRVERYPANLTYKLNLAERLMEVQKWQLAIPQLQKASQDPRQKGKAQFMLGMCFMRDTKLPLARGQFERALPEMNFETDPKSYLECNYWLARVCEELGDGKAAEKYYGDVVVQDYDYKDALKRMEKLQAGGKE